MYTRQKLPKLYHLDNDNQTTSQPKQDDKMKTRKLSPISTSSSSSSSSSKLISTTTLDMNSSKANEIDTKCSQTDAAVDIKPNDPIEIKKENDGQTNCEELLNESNENQAIEPSADEQFSDVETAADKSEESKTFDCELNSKNDSKNSSQDDLKDSFESKESDKQDASPEMINKLGKTPVNLNVTGLFEVINELKRNSSRVTKLSVEKCFQRRNTSLSKNEITDFINKCLNQDILEKVPYREYQGIRLKQSIKNSLKFVNNDEQQQELLDKNSEENDRLSNANQDALSNLDNLSECSSNINALNDDLDDDSTNATDASGYNTKKNSLKRCSPTIRYMLRTAPESGISANDMLNSLKTKRILILYSLKKFIWLMKTFFVDKGIAEQLSNGNYKLIMNNEEENSNASAIKSQSDADPSGSVKKDDEIDLLADEKFSDNEIFESSNAQLPSSIEKQTQVEGKSDLFQKTELIKQVNRTSNYLTVEKINQVINEIHCTNKSFSLANILHEMNIDDLSEVELAAFLVRCCESGLLDENLSNLKDVILFNIEKSKVFDALKINEMTYQKVISGLKVLLRNAVLTPDQMLIGLKGRFKLLEAYDLVSFNDLIRKRLMKEGFFKCFSNNSFTLLSEIIDETSNASIHSASNLETDFADLDMIDSNSGDKLNLKRKYKTKEESKLLPGRAFDDSTLRRPISQRKKIKKSLGPDFLDPSGVKYQLLKSSYEDKCEICLKNSDSTMVDCRKCKFKAHRLCLGEIDLFFKKNLKKFECASCRIKCCFCKREPQSLVNNIVTCKKCNSSYHRECLLNQIDIAKFVKSCTACEKAYFKHLMNSNNDKTKLAGNCNLISSKDDPDSQLSFNNNNNNLEIDEALSSDINVRPNILDQVPTLDQLKEIEMSDNFNLNQVEMSDKRQTNIKAATNAKESESNSVNDESNDDSNQSNAGSSSIASLNSNPENSTTKRLVAEDEELVQKYRKLFKAYDVHQQVKISKEQFNILKSLNSYSNGKNPIDWTVDDVAEFITSIGFPEESTIFKKEEIDGKSLLLLRRNDVLTGLSMRLGPALKVYSYIYKLQASI